MIHVVVLTGFLGSGKTTLLNRWLTLGGGRAPGGGRLALVVNELGAVGIDGALLPGGITRQIELPGGCVCCQLDEDLVRTVDELGRSLPDLELIVVETTGVADPLPIGWTLERPPLDQRVRLTCVVTVVDASLHAVSRTLSPAVDSQVAGADILVLSKLDLVGGPDGVAVRQLGQDLAATNAVAPIVALPTDEAAAAVWQLLADPPVDGLRVARPAFARPSGGHGFASESFAIDGTLDFEELTAALEGLPPSVVRIKGIARVVDRSTGSARERTVVFHRVGARVSAEEIGEVADHRMVAIGTDLDRNQLSACISAAMIG